MIEPETGYGVDVARYQPHDREGDDQGSREGCGGWGEKETPKDGLEPVSPSATSETKH